MNNHHLRRAIIALLVIASGVFGRMAFAATDIDTSVPQTQTLQAPVLSPQRFPAALGTFATQASARNEIAGRMTSLGTTWCMKANNGGQPVFAVRQATTLIPASTVKLLTASATLDHFGPNHTFETKVVGNKANNGRVTGGLKLVGGGDPLLMTGPYAASINNSKDVHTSLEALADQVVQSGVRRVEGGIGVDDTVFDRQRSLSSWDPSYVAQAQVGSLSAMLVDQGVRNDNGRIVVSDPNLQAAETFATLLRQRGVDVQPGTGNTESSDELATIRSRPLADIVGQMLTQSDNTTAEMLLKNLGAATSDSQGTTSNGLEAVRKHLESIGIDTTEIVLVDGSGLSRANRVSCVALEDVLSHAGFLGPLSSGLAVAGRTGTLAERMTDPATNGLVQAKTGTLNQVSALAGWAGTQDNEPVDFSLIVNGVPTSAAEAAQDDIAAILATLPQTPSQDAYAPR